ncbi:uncharacterized protein LOC107266331 [Cephus cinctus]|uniref:Uncharacterized protein LOC107266331 n=1 Tax=Cephus cinctus TaxID=211228 RepID=A0AAJ7RF61_CEPCN|nr:uncharacterized protein LOC107266331 [Cephus cinctus]XP_015592187.1 uncharacterized protein LOC107266331 [Cephus cinctus]XP_024939343.1 uncharacterized protein LOC107266331 [Cephus cinctus]XP_024939344.1 uncharacterized protein LOC107266331 [Cephus cinctus]XP_024939345.1 uncharacterized protein LOC107266331 [Cephus cinctus]XP_024939346.1 uncharacterized protein LOC107266331 [Cephus cinctus]
MHQPVIFTGTRGVSTMSLNAGANKWASRAVVVLQLAAWSAVGVVLLQKGVSSLQKVQEPRNSTLESNATTMEILKMVKLQEDDDQLAVIPIAVSDNTRNSESDDKLGNFEKNTNSNWGQSFDSMELANFETSLKTRDSSKGMRGSARKNSNSFSDFNDQSNRNFINSDQSTSVQSSENVSKQETHDNEDNTDKKDPDISQNSNSSETNNKRVPVDDEIMRKFHQEITKKTEENRLNSPIISHKVDVLQDSGIADIPQSYKNENQDSNDAESNSKESQSVMSETRKENSSWESKRKYRVTKLSSGGAAAAVAMVAVGTVMLVLGPVVIILRALDERRQERRFLKLSGQDDLPPSYEQATLMDEAPRYSTLSLNTIFGPPPPPSPTPATSARSHAV